MIREINLPSGATARNISMEDAEKAGATDSAIRAALTSDAYHRVNVDHGAALLRLTGSASQAERDTWAVKEAAARAVIDGTAGGAQAQMIALEASARGQSPAELAQVVISKADNFRISIGAAGAARATANAAIQAAEGSDVLDVVRLLDEAVHNLRSALIEIESGDMP